MSQEPLPIAMRAARDAVAIGQRGAQRAVGRVRVAVQPAEHVWIASITAGCGEKGASLEASLISGPGCA